MTTPASAPAAPPRPSLPREVATVFRFELRQLLVSLRTAWSMSLYAGFAALAVLSMLWAARKLEAEAREKSGEALPEEFAELSAAFLLRSFGWGDEGLAAELLRDGVPLIYVAFFGVASWALPLLVALVTFDQFSELSTRGARFVLLRARRVGYFLGKAAAAAAAVALFLAVMWGCVLAAALVRDAAPGPAVREAVRAWALMCVLALPYLGLTAVVSALARPAVAFIATFAVWVLLSVGALAIDHSNYPQFGRIFPWHHAPGLIVRYVPTLLAAVASLAAIALVAYGAALAIVRRRDV